MRVPRTVVDRSRAGRLRRLRRLIRHCRKAVAFARMVSRLPAPARMYARGSGSSTWAALSSNCERSSGIAPAPAAPIKVTACNILVGTP